MSKGSAVNTGAKDISNGTAKPVQNKGLPGTEKPNGEIPVPQLPFTMEDVRKAVPKECFEKDLTKSMYYMIRDWAFVAICYYFREYFFNFGIIGKFVWWNITGFFGWCLFVVAHDCGHTTFSNYPIINNIIGHICNAPILVPFHGWQNSHRKHHSYHSHIEKDHSWSPTTYSDYKTYGIFRYVRFSVLSMFAYPWYLIKEQAGQGFTGNHFNPWSQMFNDKERVGAAISSASVIAFLGFLFYNWNFSTLLSCYFAPYFVFVFWLDLVTYLQHSDHKMLYYREGTWNYFLGAFSTVDRNFGSIINHLHHNIETHLLHHIFFTQIPHYNLVKATDAVKEMLGDYYIKDESLIPFALFRSLKKCIFVPDEGQVLKYETYEAIPEYEKKYQQAKTQ